MLTFDTFRFAIKLKTSSGWSMLTFLAIMSKFLRTALCVSCANELFSISAIIFNILAVASVVGWIGLGLNRGKLWVDIVWV